MLTLDVHKYMVAHVRGRAPVLPGEANAPSELIRTFSDGTRRIHVVFDAEACRAVLEGDAFRQPRFAELLAKRLERDAPSCLASDFFGANPIAQDGAAHKARRQQFLRRFNALRRAISTDLAEAAAQAAADLARGDHPGRFIAMVSGYLDRVGIQLVGTLTGIAPDPALWAGSAACLFEILPSQVALGQKEAQARRLLAAATEAQPMTDLDRGILLSFLNQGRDPIEGALIGLLIHLASSAPDERSHLLGNIDGAQIFNLTYPVNYISREAARATRVAGADINAGELVFLALASTVSPDTSRGLAFGAGSHVCAGQALSIDIAEAWLTAL